MKTKFLLLIATAITTLSFPDVNFAQAPNLGAAANFLLFSTSGAIGSTGISSITGDVGTNAGAITGFGGIIGVIHNADAVTAQAAIDLQAAWQYVKNLPPTATIGPVLGNGATLYAGVDTIAAAGSVAGVLTLDAQGNSNAVFIIKAGGAITTAASATVNLVNGALASNVFWVAEGAISMATLTVMRGTLIAHNGAIDMGAGGLIEGRALAIPGAVSVYGTDAFFPFGFVPLPIKLLTFTGVCDGENVMLKWSTATETNNSYFTVERRAEGMNWQTIGRVEGAGNSSVLHTYSLIDELPGKAISQYRLKQTDFDGNNKYGMVIDVNKCGENAVKILTVYPNPSAGKFVLSYTGDRSGIYSTEVTDCQGSRISGSTGFQSAFDLSGNAQGVYFVQVHLHEKTMILRIVLRK